MNDIDAALQDLKKELYDQPIIKEYFRLSSLMQSDSDIVKYDRLMREHQKKMVENMKDDDIYFVEKQEYEKYRNLLVNNPLVADFEEVKVEVQQLLNEVKKALE